MAADIYSNPQHPGRGGWTWYTGSASWAYKTGVENILGFRLNGDQLTLDPRVPSEWSTFTIKYKYGNSLYIIKYDRSTTQSPSHSATQSLTLVDDGQTHEININ